MTILQLPSYLKDLGCQSALNFDGGWPSTIIIHDVVVNSLSGRECSFKQRKNAEREISDAILILARNKD